MFAIIAILFPTLCLSFKLNKQGLEWKVVIELQSKGYAIIGMVENTSEVADKEIINRFGMHFEDIGVYRLYHSLAFNCNVSSIGLIFCNVLETYGTNKA